jgi:hypothetical protein
MHYAASPPVWRSHRNGPDRQRIFVRPVRPEDDIGLRELYESLNVDDRYTRFFSAHHPRPEFYTELTTEQERGGARVVAVLSGLRSGEGRLIGEAGYSLLPNGNGELDITVARGWRARLTACLLDSLADAAAAADVPNLEAEVLTTDRPTLAWLREHGPVIMEHHGWSAVRVLIGTGGRTATWPGPHDSPRVLVETAGGRWHAENAARSAGLELLMCAGPTFGARQCPALMGERCALAAGADMIIVSHPTGDQWNHLLAGHADLHETVRVVVEPSRAQPAETI